MTTTVLIVDDHAGFRHQARRLLTRSGFDVVGDAADAASGLRDAEVLRPDVVLLDVMLPDRSGVDVADELLGGAHPPRVILTSSRERSDFDPDMPWPRGCTFVPKHELSVRVLRRTLGQP